MPAAAKPESVDSRAFYERSALEVAPKLLNKILLSGDVSGRIVEVEAYMAGDDPGSHGYRGVTPRTEVMFGPPGHLYVYFSYGMHWCANVVCSPVGVCSAVLIRALEPLEGTEAMFERRRKARRTKDLCSGPAKLCQALAIDGEQDGLDLFANRSPVRIFDDGTASPAKPAVSKRIGLAMGKGEDLPWRFCVPDSPWTSR